MINKTAILFFGIHYLENYTRFFDHNTNIIYNIDYKNSFYNYKSTLLKFFNNSDIFLSTNDSKNVLELKEDFNCLSCTVNNHYNNSEFRYKEAQDKLISGLDLILRHQVENNVFYENIIITRFDLLFMIAFENVYIDYSKINVVSDLQDGSILEDNFYIIPGSFLNIFKNIIRNNPNRHDLKYQFEQHLGINYLYRENVKWVKDLSFYKVYHYYNFDEYCKKVENNK
jgi:hypothetical protein